MANPLQFLLLNQVVAPAIQAALPQQGTTSATGAATGAAPDIAALQAQMVEMQQKINDLEARMPGNG